MMGTGVAAAVVAAMRLHNVDARLQAFGCQVVQNLCRHDTGRDALARAHKTGIVTTVLSALREHGADADVQISGCGDLINLAVTAEHARQLCAA
jgi:hypothetical protein